MRRTVLGQIDVFNHFIPFKFITNLVHLYL